MAVATLKDKNKNFQNEVYLFIFIFVLGVTCEREKHTSSLL